MPKKAKPRRSARSTKTPPSRTPVLSTLLRGFLRLFAEELPVTVLNVREKPNAELAESKTPDHQAALETLCGGRSTKAQKQFATGVLTPDTKSGIWRVTIEGRSVGQLKPADAKFLAKQLAKAEVGPCAVKVAALIEGGQRRKNGALEHFTVKVALPPRPQKKVTPPADVVAVDQETD
jgi:hypothetical protein